ncbi:MAG: hypothetical protein ACI8ZN_002796 [Bacteroidia bacterium]|jgi:hypothetical protein
MNQIKPKHRKLYSLFEPRLFLYSFLVLFVSFSCAGQQRLQQQPFDVVVFNSPANITRGGLKIEAEFSVKDHFSLAIYTSHISTRYTNFYNIDQDNQLGINLIPGYVTDANFGIKMKNYFVRYSKPFHGYYAMVFAENGRGSELFYTQLGDFFIMKSQWNNFSYHRFGLAVGREWTLFNRGVIDAYVGLGYNNTLTGEPRKYSHVFSIGQFDQPYFTAGASFGIGQYFDKSRTVRKAEPTTLNLSYAMLLDFNALFRSGVQVDVLFANKGNNLWKLHGMFRSNKRSTLQVGSADTYTGFGAGIERRNYPFSNMQKRGVYFGVGAGIIYEEAEFSNSENGLVTRSWKEHYLPVNLSYSMGLTTYFEEALLIDVYIKNAFTISKENLFVKYALPEDATGIHTMIGIKAGFAMYKK